MIATLLPLAVVFLLIGFPVFLAILIPSFVSMAQFYPDMGLNILIQQMIGGVNTYSLLAIPFFIFAADIISNGQIGKRLINLTNTMVGHLPGGLAMATVVTCTFFGAISGAGSAAVVAIGSIVYPILTENGYSKKFTIGLILASSSLAMLIPPGIGMILYSTVNTDASIKDMFAGGLILGILTAIAFMIYCYIYAVRYKVPRTKFVGFKNILIAFKEAGWSLGLPVLILGGIYLGFTTVTEAASLAVAYSLFVEMVIYKELKIKNLWGVTIKSGTVITMLLVLIGAGKAISYLMTIAGLPQLISNIFGGYDYLIVFLLINIVFLIAGMFIDPNSAIIILTPLIAPIASQLGIDPVHLGLVIVFNLSIGMISPPFGLNIFIAQGTFKIPYGKIIPGLVPFLIINLIVLFLVTYIPDLIMWFPSLLKN